MKTKLVIAVLVILALGGCATRTGTAIVAGTTGMIIGSAMSQPRTIIVHEEPVIIVAGTCNHYYTYSERAACERGARQRYYEQQRHRDNAAFRSGYGHR